MTAPTAATYGAGFRSRATSGIGANFGANGVGYAFVCLQEHHAAFLWQSA